jgi:multiple sugar transport system permease protein
LKRSLVKSFLIYAILAIIVSVSAFPYVWMLIESFQGPLDVLQTPPVIGFNAARGAATYNYALNYLNILKALINTAIIAGVAVLAAEVLGTLAAYGLSRLKFRRKDNVSMWILSNWFMPPTAVGFPIFVMIAIFHLTDSLVGAIIPMVSMVLPLIIWLNKAFMDDVPKEIDDSALVDGCTRFSAFTRVILPLARTGITTSGILALIFIWNEFMILSLVATTPNSFTVSVAAGGLVSMTRSIDWNLMGAVGVLTTTPVLIFGLLVQKYIVRGLTLGAVKG